jgi:hypothetical protein
MLKQADHLAKIKRIKVDEKALAPLAVYYEVLLLSLGRKICLTLFREPSVN